MKNSYNSEDAFLRALMDTEEKKTPAPVAEPEPEEAPEEELQPVESVSEEIAVAAEEAPVDVADGATDEN